MRPLYKGKARNEWSFKLWRLMFMIFIAGDPALPLWRRTWGKTGSNQEQTLYLLSFQRMEREEEGVVWGLIVGFIAVYWFRVR